MREMPVKKLYLFEIKSHLIPHLHSTGLVQSLISGEIISILFPPISRVMPKSLLRKGGSYIELLIRVQHYIVGLASRGFARILRYAWGQDRSCSRLGLLRCTPPFHHLSREVREPAVSGYTAALQSTQGHLFSSLLHFFSCRSIKFSPVPFGIPAYLPPSPLKCLPQSPQKGFHKRMKERLSSRSFFFFFCLAIQISLDSGSTKTQLPAWNWKWEMDVKEKTL